MSTPMALLALVALLAANAYFVAAEFAMVTARRDQIEPRALEGSTAAKYTLKRLEDVSVALAATQLGITACSLLIGAVGEPALAHLFERPMVALGLPASASHVVALVIALLIVTFLHMVLAEMVPKNIAIARPAQTALALGPLLHLIVVVARPVIWLMNSAANILVRLLFKVEPRDEVASSVTSEQMRNLVHTSGESGLLDEDEMALVSGALVFGERTAADVAVPVAELVTLPRTTTPVQVEEECARSGFSRFPLTDSSGAMVGYVHTKDVLGLGAASDDEVRHLPVPDSVVRPLGAVGPHDPLRIVLARMQRESAHLAVLTDPHTQALESGAERNSGSTAVEAGAAGEAGEAPLAGGADAPSTDSATALSTTRGPGVVMLEDVLEELVGEVSDATRH